MWPVDNSMAQRDGVITGLMQDMTRVVQLEEYIHKMVSGRGGPARMV